MSNWSSLNINELMQSYYSPCFILLFDFHFHLHLYCGPFLSLFTQHPFFEAFHPIPDSPYRAANRSVHRCLLPS